MQYILPIYHEGFTTDEETFFDGLFFPSASTVNKIILTARQAPTGSNLTIDLLKNGAEQSRVATLTAGSTYETTDITDIEYSAAERLGLKVKSIGTTLEGSGIGIFLVVTDRIGGSASTDLTTLADVKSYMGITDSSDDALLELLIDRVSKYIETYCNRTFASVAYDELYDGNDRDFMVIKNCPITAFSTLEIDGEAVASGDWFWYDYGEVALKPGNRFGTKRQSVRCVYTAGYSTIPDDIQDAATKLVAMSWYNKSGDRLGVSSKSLSAQGSITFIKSEVPTEVSGVLDSYRFFNVGGSRAK